MLRKGVLPSIIVFAIIAVGSNPNSDFATNHSILINEIELNPLGNDNSSDVEESVELYNPTSKAVDISGWTISSTAGAVVTVTIADGTSISPKAYLVIGRGSQWLDNSNESVVLRTKNGDTVNSVGTFSDDKNDAHSWQRSPDASDTWIFTKSTLASPNFAAGSLPMPPEEPASSSPPKTPTAPPEPSVSNNTTNQSQNITAPNELTIVFIDVGQGDSTLLMMPNKKTILIDGGEREKSQSISAILLEYNITKLDVIIATHPHADHIGGLIDIMNGVAVGRVLDSGQVHTTQTFQDFLEVIETRQIPLFSVREGDTIYLDSSVNLQVLNPPVTLPDAWHNEPDFNNNSVVLKLTFGGFAAIFPGDIESQTESRLAAKEINVDVALASHHGSGGSNSLPYLKSMSPSAVVIYAGKNNPYGHPHQDTLQRIDEAQVEHILRTDMNGTIVLRTYGDGKYTLETSGKVVFVPEFANIAILVGSVSLISIVVIMRSGLGKTWKT